MGKVKKEAAEEQPAEVVVEEQPAEVVVEVQPDADAVVAVVKPRTWNGYPILECPEPHCKYDTIYERELNDHVNKAHALSPVVTPARLVTTFDRYGNEQKG